MNKFGWISVGISTAGALLGVAGGVVGILNNNETVKKTTNAILTNEMPNIIDEVAKKVSESNA